MSKSQWQQIEEEPAREAKRRALAKLTRAARLTVERAAVEAAFRLGDPLLVTAWPEEASRTGRRAWRGHVAGLHLLTLRDPRGFGKTSDDLYYVRASGLSFMSAYRTVNASPPVEEMWEFSKAVVAILTGIDNLYFSVSGTTYNGTLVTARVRLTSGNRTTLGAYVPFMVEARPHPPHHPGPEEYTGSYFKLPHCAVLTPLPRGRPRVVKRAKLSPEDVLRLVDAVGGTVAAAKVTGAGASTVRHWTLGTRPVPERHARALEDEALDRLS